jgi:hypothetical protein
MWAPHHTIIARFLPDVVNHILGYRQRDINQSKVAAATIHGRLATSCAIALLGAMNNAKKRWVA